MKYLFYLLITLSVGTTLFSCSDKKLNEEDLPVYDGPVVEADSISTLYSDSAIVRIKLMAKKQFEFENGDRDFPEGMYMEFYEPDGRVSSTLVANQGHYYREENLYKATGDVRVNSVDNGDKLNTEELFWNPTEEKVYTDKFVRVEQEGDITTGEGLEAAQDFSTWRILKPTGFISMDEEEDEEE
ncbi:LPS export ABC transporter periplasmic protein LptC [Cytophagales bacterium LB-30]|uniref:LPS export ABC transporter periplasmic protein LptC n=1 Tax=Shiella aurantiaca TaxID=3058365 RepID=A0ABT8F5U7_9BACT|nr:LPS export ABC transporter periplasmic protein LptC [Shiella aurantiaca]MDN4165825.1 LPS export ABC transporter periplasmic protein LptC [Shiella aurantiaca]